MRWLVATVAETVPETLRATTLRLDVPGWPGHRAGQHVDMRLTAEDGYSAHGAIRSLGARGGPLELTVVRFDDGEVSPYLTEVADVGDQFELRGPIGGWFVWDGDDATPVLLVGGGSGVAPLMAMMRHHLASAARRRCTSLYSARTLDDVLYRYELQALVDSRHRAVTITLTRESPRRGPAVGPGRRRPARAMAVAAAVQPHCYVCGPTPFVEAVSGALVGSATSRVGWRPNDSDPRRMT